MKVDYDLNKFQTVVPVTKNEIYNFMKNDLICCWLNKGYNKIHCECTNQINFKNCFKKAAKELEYNKRRNLFNTYFKEELIEENKEFMKEFDKAFNEMFGEE